MVGGLSKYVCQLILRIDWKDGNCFVCHMLSEMMVLDSNVFRGWSEFWALCYSDADVVIFKYLAVKLRLRIVKREDVSDFYH